MMKKTKIDFEAAQGRPRCPSKIEKGQTLAPHSLIYSCVIFQHNVPGDQFVGVCSDICRIFYF